MWKRTIITLFLLGPLAVRAGLFDDVLNKAKEVEERVKQTVDKMSDSQQSETTAETPAASQSTETAVEPSQPVAIQSTVQPKPDPQLVTRIQQRLKALGYKVGVIDGIYGKGTRSAIMAFQEDQGGTVDGEPDQGLLAQLESAHAANQQQLATAQATLQETPSAAGGDTAIATPAAVERAVLSYHPEALNDEDLLKQAVSRIYKDEWDAIAHDEFAWQKRRESYKSRLLDEIKSPPVTFTVAPWIRKSSGGKIALGKYDFEKNAFAIRGSLIDLPTSGYDSRPLIRKLKLSEIAWLPMDADSAEKLSNSADFRQDGHRLYPKFEYTITGAKKYTNKGRTKLYPEVALDEIHFYLYRKQLWNPDKPADAYVHVASLALNQTPAAQTVADKSKKPAYSIPSGVTLLEAGELRDALVGNTLEGASWAAYFSTDNQVETLWRQQSNTASYTIDGSLICFDEDAGIATTPCIAASMDEQGKLSFYELSGGKKLIPYRVAPTPFTHGAKIRSGRIAALLDPEGHVNLADADVIGLKLGMALPQADQIIRQHRSDMEKSRFNGRLNGNTLPWEPGRVHVRYESPDKQEVIGLQLEPPAADNQITLLWRSLRYDINSGAPTRDAVVEALYEKYGGSAPGKSKYPSSEVHAWINKGGELRSSLECQARPNPLPAPLSLPGPLNDIDTQCGESVTAELRVQAGHVTRLNIYLVNQAKLSEIIEANQSLHLSKSTQGVPEL